MHPPPLSFQAYRTETDQKLIVNDAENVVPMS